MSDLPPDPRAVIDARIRHFKKETQKLNLEFLEAQADLEKMKQARQDGQPVRTEGIGGDNPVAN